MEIARLLEHQGFKYTLNNSDQFVVKDCPFCPAAKGHADNLWKLYIDKKSGLFFCHRCEAKGHIRQFAEKFAVRDPDAARLNLVDQYLYQDEFGCTHVRVTRLEDKLGNKIFYQERLEHGSWKKGGAHQPLQPFRYVEWEHEPSIVIVEGEKCVLAMRTLGFAATTFIGGCNGWKDDYARYFKDKVVFLLPDQDTPGFKFMSLVAAGLARVVSSYKVVILHGLKDKEDVCDWIRNGGTAQKFSQACEEALENTLVQIEKNATKPEIKTVWRTVTELPSIHTPVEDIAPEIIPEVLRDWITDIAERMQVPLICVAVLALTVVGSLIGRKARVCPKKEDDWYEVANLWSMIIMPSGRLKSPIINAVLKPLQELSEQADSELTAILEETEISHAIADAKIQAIKKEIQKIASSQAQDRDQRLENAQMELLNLQKAGERPKPNAKRYKIHDATVEKIGELLKNNTNGLLLVRDELSGWLASLDRVGRDGDREFFLESWNGKGSYDVDRIIRGSLHIPALCLSILGGLPPSKIESYVESAVSGGAGNDGLLQRFGLMVHADFKKDWRLVDRAPDKKAYERVRNVFKGLDHLAFVDHPTEDNALIFRFDASAQGLFYEWLIKLENKIRAEENECDAFVSHISKYRKLVPVLALQFFVLKKIEDPNIGKAINKESLEAAIKWARHLENHARRVYSLALNPQIHAARSLAQKIKQGKIADGIRLRDIYRHQWTNLKTRASVDMAVAVLIECGWVAIEDLRLDIGAPSEIMRLNPSLIQLDKTDISHGFTSVSFVNQQMGL